MLAYKIVYLGMDKEGKFNQKIQVMVDNKMLDDLRAESTKKGIGVSPLIRNILLNKFHNDRKESN